MKAVKLYILKMDKTKILANRLKELRENLGLTLADFAKSVGLKPQTYSAYEKDVNKPPVDVLIKIASKYKVSLDYLCGLSNFNSKKIHLDTCADILNLIFELGLVDGIEIDSNFVKKLDDDTLFPFDTQYLNFMMLHINDTTINDALKKWKKMLDLFNNGVIDEEVYRLWVERTLPEYSSLYNADRNVMLTHNIEE